MSSSYIPYIVTDVFCMVFAASILFRLNKSMGSEHEILELRNMIYTYIVMLVTDIFWAFFESDILVPNRWINISIDAILVMSISFGSYFWFMFILDRLYPTSPVKKSKLTFYTIPIIVVSLLDIISIFTGFFFYIDSKNHYQSTGFFWIQSIVDYFYLVIPTIACAYRAISSQSKREKKEFATYAAYMIAPTIGVSLEDILPFVPVLALCMFMVIQILFLMIQNMQIYHDALTQLNNRRKLDQYLGERLRNASSEHPILLIIMDVNQFKYINDTFGHIEGDNALRTVAHILRDAADSYRAFVARYGGDEFCLVIDAVDKNPKDIMEDIQQRVHREQTENEKYILSLSMGYVLYEKPEYNVNDAFNQADRMLYACKREWHNQYK